MKVLAPILLISLCSFNVHSNESRENTRSDFVRNDYNCYLEPLNHIARERGGIEHYGKVDFLDKRIDNFGNIYYTDGTQIEIEKNWVFKWWKFGTNKQWCGHNDKKLHFKGIAYTRMLDQTDTGPLLNEDEVKQYGDYITPRIDDAKWELKITGNKLRITSRNRDPIVGNDMFVTANYDNCKLTLNTAKYRPLSYGETFIYTIPKSCSIDQIDILVRDTKYKNSFTIN